MGLDGFIYETADRGDLADQRWDRVSLIYKLLQNHLRMVLHKQILMYTCVVTRYACSSN